MQDYLSSSDLCPQEPLEINNDEVARSLGITEYLRKKETHPSSAPECSSQEMKKGQLQDTSGQKREREQAVVATGERLATVKKARTAALPTDVPECPAAISECQQKPGSSRASASKGKSHVLWVALCSVVLLAGTDVPKSITLGAGDPFSPI